MLLTVDYATIFVGFAFTVVGGIIGWLIALSFKAGAKNNEVEQNTKDIEDIYKELRIMQGNINQAQNKANMANVTAEAAHSMVKEAVSLLDRAKSEISAKVDSVKDEILELYKRKK